MIRLVFIPLVVVLGFRGRKKHFTPMNEAGTAAGLPAFGESTKDGQLLPEHAGSGKTVIPETLWNQVCEKIMGLSHEIEKLVGTPAYCAGEKDCEAAVQHWTDGFSLFNNKLPPNYAELNNPDVYTDNGVSFVALYNPKASPVASCAFVTCTKTSAFAPQRSRSPDVRSLRRLQNEPQRTTTAVICLTNPEALKTGEAPFKEEEWQKIVQAIVGTEECNGASHVRTSLALGLIMMISSYGPF
ncbi:SAG family member [Eimeria tenella]|uniref:SAG family member n=1 Tax=Eimeria tenella TaxID=5802 RepID=U6L086_EIMTE|nr:LOW QUALITY PROTEIN: SAG family member [Eimeria tenella]CDJ41979.1 SAG family member [Eimeria tenella]|eukprot:XP_013232729.1 LOW QUALITY PROTEIN: SAG family member [Eimeria tenella]